MALVKIKNTAMPIAKDQDGNIKWCPAFDIEGKENLTPISHQGHVPLYDTKEEALKHFDE